MNKKKQIKNNPISKKLNRRQLITGTASLGAIALAPKKVFSQDTNPENLPPNLPEWTQYLGDGVDVNPYGVPSEYEAHVIRRNVEWLTASAESSVNFTPLQDLEGIVTPNGLCFERHHGGVSVINPNDFRLMINGLVDREMIFTLDDLKRFPQTNKFYFLECAANGGMEWRGSQLNGCQYTFGMVHNVQYTGVKLSDLLLETGLKDKAKWVLAEGSDSSGMTRSIPIEKLLDDCIIAWAMNGEALRPEQGYPARLVVPFFKGITRERLGKLGLQWPVKEDGTDTKILHEKEFKLGKGRLKSFHWQESTELKNNKKEYPLILTTSRVLQHYNAATMTRRTKNVKIVDEDILLLHPNDARSRELNSGDIARLYSGRGEVSLKVEVTDKVKEGIVFTTFHFPEHMVNMVTGDGKDEETKCAEYKVSAVNVQKISNKFKTEITPKETEAEVR